MSVVEHSISTTKKMDWLALIAIASHIQTLRRLEKRVMLAELVITLLFLFANTLPEHTISPLKQGMRLMLSMHCQLDTLSKLSCPATPSSLAASFLTRTVSVN